MILVKIKHRSNASRYFPGALRIAFGSGLLFLFPYLGIYIIGWRYHFTVFDVSLSFLALHVVMGVLGIVFVTQLLLQARKTELVFWIFLVILLIIPGAYLEYPADPWEHVRRIFSWNGIARISDNEREIRWKFAYFWFWSWLSYVPIEWRRGALGLCSAFTQLLVCWQLYQLVRRLGFPVIWAYVQVISFLLLFGTDLFGLRYYALSSTPFAYAAYLRGVLLLIESSKQKRWGILWEVPLLLVLMLFNHYQEILLFVFSATVIVLGSLFLSVNRERQRLIAWCFGITSLLSFPCGFYFRSAAAYPYQWLGWDRFTTFGTFDIAHVVWRVPSTLGIAGFIGMLFALVFVRRYPLLAVMTLAPLFVFTVPLFTLPFIVLASTEKIYSGTDFYRLFYAMPPSLMLVAGLREVLSWLLNYHRRSDQGPAEWGALVASVVAIVVFAVNPASPWYGRLQLQFLPSPSGRSLEQLDVMAAWLHKQRGQKLDCNYLADTPTSFFLSAYFGYPLIVDRRNPVPFGQSASEQHLEMLANEAQYRNCGVLVPTWTELPVLTDSKVANLSGHWKSNWGDIRWYWHPQSNQIADYLVSRGWKKTKVPPFYNLYEAAVKE